MNRPIIRILLGVPILTTCISCSSTLLDEGGLAGFLARHGAGGTHALSLEEELKIAPKALSLDDDTAEQRRTDLQGTRTRLSLDECLALAICGSDSIAAQEARRTKAEALHMQATAAYWPQLSGRVYANYLGDEPTFGVPSLGFDVPTTSFQTDPMQFATAPFAIQTPSGVIQTPPISLQTPATVVTTPASVLNVAPGVSIPVPSQQITVPPQGVSLPGQAIPIPSQSVQVPSQSVNVPAQTIEVEGQRFTTEDQEIKVADNLTKGASLDVTWLLADGGERKARRKAALAGVNAARQGERRAAIDLLADVRRYYFSAIAASRALDIADDVLERMHSALKITETFYKGESLTVTKIDYLRNKMQVESYESVRADLAVKYELACAALSHSIGLDYTSVIEPQDRTLPPLPVLPGLAILVEQGFRFDPDWNQLLAGLEAARQGEKQARSGFLPRVALQGSLYTAENGLDTGFATESNLTNWQIGVGVEIPLFSGFLTKGRLKEAKAKIANLEANQMLLRRGLGLQIKKAVLEINASAQQRRALAKASATSIENRDLTDKAYSVEMAEADELFEALYYSARFQAEEIQAHHAALEAGIRLDKIVGGVFSEMIVSELGMTSDLNGGIAK